MSDEDKTKRPHVAVINCIMDISYLLDDGQVSGVNLNKETLKSKGLKPNFIMIVEGCDLEDCIQKVKEKIQQFNTR